MSTQTTECCIVGGGPAGMMAGLLLARQGVDVVVLEKHEDFFRDFRGDTIHPATLELLDELGIAEDFLRLPHTKMERVTMDTPEGPVTFADFTKLAGPFGFIAFVPQWDFLDFIADKAAQYPTFQLVRPAEVTDLVEEDGRVVGVRASTPNGTLEIRASLVLAADGRHSVLRERAGLPVAAKSSPIDVLWFRVARKHGERLPFFRKDAGGILICIDRGDYWQLAYVIAARQFDAVKASGLMAFREAIASAVPALRDRVGDIANWEAVNLLSVRVDRLERWYAPGLLCIGDAAHAMSPAGGVGINLAIQDAVAAANVIGPTFARGGPKLKHLGRVQRRRELPVRLTQAFQVRALRGLYQTDSAGSAREPVPFRLIRRFPPMRHLVGRFIGRGFRREHVRTKESRPAAASIR